jgi:hypothetical protein
MLEVVGSNPTVSKSSNFTLLFSSAFSFLLLVSCRSISKYWTALAAICTHSSLRSGNATVIFTELEIEWERNRQAGDDF